MAHHTEEYDRNSTRGTDQYGRIRHNTKSDGNDRMDWRGSRGRSRSSDVDNRNNSLNGQYHGNRSYGRENNTMRNGTTANAYSHQGMNAILSLISIFRKDYI